VTLDSLSSARARADHALLEQYLLVCPGCRKPAAAHVDPAGPTLVRLVCPDSCVVAADAVLGQLPVGELTLSA
jgi:hypothetical protein